MRLRDELIATARRMSDLGLTPGLSGNASVRTPQGFLVTPSGIPYAELAPSDPVEIKLDGSMRGGQRAPSTEWQLHRDVYLARPDATAIVHTHSLYCTAISCLRRPIPPIHYMIALSGADEIPCADYATFGTPALAAAVVRALAGSRACLMANHGMLAIGDGLPSALRLASETETLASQFFHATLLGSPHVLTAAELHQVRDRFAGYGQPKKSR
jgi:L-fuculose-phosphate aldolase